MKKILMSLFTIAIVGTLITGSTIAYLSDVEKVGQNVFTAGTLDLKVNGEDEPNIESINLSDMKPGDKYSYVWTLKNAGSIPGQPWVEFSAIVNNENDLTEPEISEGDTGEPGELGRHINANIWNGLTPKTWWYANPLNVFGGEKFGDTTDPTYVYPSIGEKEQVKFILQVEIPAKVGNIIQSDSVEFEIIFHLDQA